VAITLPKDMRLRLMKYAGTPGVTLYLDKQTGERRILPTAFYLALKDLRPERYEHIETAPSLADIIRKYGASDWTKMVGSVEELEKEKGEG